VIVVCFCNVVANSVVIGSAIVGLYCEVTLHFHIFAYHVQTARNNKRLS